MSKQIVDLNSILPPEFQEADAKKLDEYIDVDLVIHHTRQLQGMKGPYMRFSVSLPGTEERFFLATGASQPFEVLNYLKEEDAFPVQARFKRVGRAIILTS